MSNGTPVVLISDPQEESVKAIKKELSFQHNLIIGILIVVALGFIAMIVSLITLVVQYQQFSVERLREFTDVLKGKETISDIEDDAQIQKRLDFINGEVQKLWETKYPVRK